MADYGMLFNLNAPQPTSITQAYVTPYTNPTIGPGLSSGGTYYSLNPATKTSEVAGQTVVFPVSYDEIIRSPLVTTDLQNKLISEYNLYRDTTNAEMRKQRWAEFSNTLNTAQQAARAAAEAPLLKSTVTMPETEQPRLPAVPRPINDWEGSINPMGLLGALFPTRPYEWNKIGDFTPTSPEFAKLQTTPAKETPVQQMSSSLLPWQRTSVAPERQGMGATDYIADYQNKSFVTPQSISPIQPMQNALTPIVQPLDNIGNMGLLSPVQEDQKKYLDEFKNTYLKDYAESNKQNLNWQDIA